MVGQPELADDARFASNHDRLANRAELISLLNEIFITRRAQDWLSELQQVGIASGPINSIQEVFEHPQTETRGLRAELKHPTAGPVGFPGIPYKMSGTPAEMNRPPPLLGQHNDEILIDTLGYSVDELSALREKKAI